MRKLSCYMLGVALCACMMLCGIVQAQASMLVITQQPESTAVYEGDLAAVTIEVKGDGLQYEWWQAAANTYVFTKSDVTGDVYAVEMNENTDGMKVYCIVSDAYNHMVQTKTVMLKMITPLQIICQPQDASALAGDTASVSVEAVGDGLKYAWWVCDAGEDAFRESGVTAPVFEQSMDEAHAGTQIYCVVTDQDGQRVQSATVTLTCRAPLVIAQQPQAVMVARGAVAEVKALATGDAVTYTWWVAANEHAPFADSGVTTDTYAVVMDENHNGNLVFCVVSDMHGNTLQTETVAISMVPPLEIIRQPQNAYAFEGEMASVSIEAVGEGVTYAWWFANANKDRFAQSLLTGNVYAQEMTTVRAGRRVYCGITDQYGQSLKSDTVFLIMKTPLAIVQQPVHMSVAKGEEASVSFSVQGDDVTYAWYVTDDAGNFVADACTQAQYTCIMDEDGDERQVYCIVTDAYGHTVQTETVTLSAIPAGLSYEIREKTAVVTGYDGGEKNLRIPAIIAGYPVTEIAGYAFAGCAQVQQLTLPDSVETIGDGAFLNCEALTVINLPAQLTRVGSGAFADCGKLQCIVLPEKLASPEKAWLSDLAGKQVQLIGANAAHCEAWARETGFAAKALQDGRVVYIQMPEKLEAVCGEKLAVAHAVYYVDGREAAEAIDWTTSEEDVATVDENGLVTLLGVGSTTITATAENGVSATCVMNSVYGNCEDAPVQ